MFQVDFELYKHFYFVAKCGSITQAAQKLFLTQPSVTKSVRKLEEELGCPLFLRTKRGVSLTPEGEALMRRIEPACQLIRSAEDEIAAMRELERGSLSIVSTEMSFMSYVLPAMERFRTKHPGIKVRFSNALNDSIIEMVGSGSVDIAIMHEPFRREPMMDVRVIERMEETLVAGSPFAYLCQRENSPRELRELPFISMPEGSSTKQYLRDYFAAQGLDFEPDLELTTVELTAQAVENGLGIGVLPARIARERIEAGHIFRVPVTVPLPPRNACLIVNRELTPGLAARAFLEELMKEQGSPNEP
ncbi:MAG: LysR family transcriptional regulator [Oscillospiraceae bacterium]